MDMACWLCCFLWFKRIHIDGYGLLATLFPVILKWTREWLGRSDDAMSLPHVSDVKHIIEVHACLSVLATYNLQQ